MKVIQLRGTNATGKTTTIREFVERGNFVVRSFQYGKREVEYHYEKERKIVVLGRYDTRVSGGVDGYITNRDMLIHIIVKAIKLIRPDLLLFEGVVYGVTFQFAYDLVRVLKQFGYDYIGICLVPPLQVAIERLSIRNGGKPVDLISVQNKWFSTVRAYKKLKESGVNVKVVDPTSIPKEHMYKIIEGEL